MEYNLRILIFIVKLLFTVDASSFDPCSSRGLLGDSCDKNEDCSGFGVTCQAGKCRCHPDYREKTDATLNSRFCSKLPDRIDQSCSDACKLPMFCNNGRCDCIRSIVIGDICLSESSLGQSCTKDQECVQPFSACISGKCQCIVGSIQNGNQCQTSSNCPTGAKPLGPCFRNSSTIQVIQNYANSGSKVDNCSQDGQYCYTDDSSNYGVCCPATCPLSQMPNKGYTCDPNQVTTALPLCPDDTHFCHRAAGQSYSSTVCCHKPCLEPTPIFIRGSCYARSFLNGQCDIDEQCDGSYGMQCTTNKICQCKPGFKPLIQNSTNVENNPAQICIRICKLNNNEEVDHNGECFRGQLSLGDNCMVDEQCPRGGQCYRGVCRCLCDKGYYPANNNRSCATVESRTVKPQAAATGSTPATFIDLIKSIFGNGSG